MGGEFIKATYVLTSLLKKTDMLNIIWYLTIYMQYAWDTRLANSKIMPYNLSKSQSI